MEKPEQNTWKDRLAGCFGNADLKFARHSLDENRAKGMLQEARDAGASRADVIAGIRAYLVSKGATQEHIDEETAFAKKWLGDR